MRRVEAHTPVTNVETELLIARALIAFTLLPGVVAFLVPLLWLAPRGADRSFDWRGAVPLLIGVALLVWCVVAFYREGRGTLAPWDPPKALVVSGVYGVSRNPMYVAVTFVLWGWALAFHSVPLALYALVVMVAFHFRVVLGEEPWLADTHGEQWTRYRARVPRWLGVPWKRDRG